MYSETFPSRLKETRKSHGFTQIEVAKELGLNLVGTETTNFGTSSMEGKLSREDTYLNMKDSVLRMVEKAEQLNVNVGIEPVAEHTLYSAEMTRRLIDEVNSAKLRVIFDPVNLILTQSDIEMQEQIFSSFVNLLGEEISALHVKDIVLENGEKIWRNIGKGSINIKPVVDRLLKINPSISALREEVKPESADIDVKALRELVGKARKEHTL
jgi:sugar phosphate isomerase/epimerase